MVELSGDISMLNMILQYIFSLYFYEGKDFYEQ